MRKPEPVQNEQRSMRAEHTDQQEADEYTENPQLNGPRPEPLHGKGLLLCAAVFGGDGHRQRGLSRERILLRGFLFHTKSGDGGRNDLLPDGGMDQRTFTSTVEVLELPAPSLMMSVYKMVFGGETSMQRAAEGQM